MAHTITWDETAPASGDDPRDGDDEIRDDKIAVRERLRLGGHHWEIGGPSLDNNAGKLACGVQAANLLTLYETDLTTAALQLNDSTSVVTAGDGLAGANSWTFLADVLQGKREGTLMVPLPASSTGRVVGVAFHNNSGGVITLLEVDAFCFTAPSGGNVDVDIHTVPASWSDPNVAGTSIVLTPPVITIATSALRAPAPITSFNDPSLADDELWVFELDAVNSAADIILTLRIQRTL